MGETQRLLTTCGLLIPSLINTVDKGVPKVGREKTSKYSYIHTLILFFSYIFQTGVMIWALTL